MTISPHAPQGTILNDKKIAGLVHSHEMISPFSPVKVRNTGEISYGLQSYGYDIRLADEFKILPDDLPLDTFIDPKNFNDSIFEHITTKDIFVPPNSMVLARSLEYMRMPRNVTGIVMGKSTYARCGIITNFTPLEAGWDGHITIEISNTTPLPVRIYANEGIAQVLFFMGDDPGLDYSQTGGTYQGQTGITGARVAK